MAKRTVIKLVNYGINIVIFKTYLINIFITFIMSRNMQLKTLLNNDKGILIKIYYLL